MIWVLHSLAIITASCTLHSRVEWFSTFCDFRKTIHLSMAFPAHNVKTYSSIVRTRKAYVYIYVHCTVNMAVFSCCKEADTHTMPVFIDIEATKNPYGWQFGQFDLRSFRSIRSKKRILRIFWKTIFFKDRLDLSIFHKKMIDSIEKPMIEFPTLRPYPYPAKNLTVSW